MNYRPLITTLVAVSLLSLGGLSARAHEGHNDAFGGNPVSAVSEKIYVSPQGQQAIGLQVVNAEIRALDQVLRVTGKAEAADGHIFQVSPTITGVARRVYVKQNDTVKAGQPLATLYSVELAQILTDLLERRNEIQTELAGLQTQYAGDIAGQEQEVALQRERYDRERRLLDEGITARKDFQQAQTDFETAKVRLNTLKQRASKETALLRQKLAMNRDSAQSQLQVMGVPASLISRSLSAGKVIAEFPVLAPASGIVTFRDVTEGMTVEPGKTLFTLVDPTPIWIHLDLYQEQIGDIHTGQPVRLVTASNQVLSGRVDTVGTVVDPEKRTLPVRIVSDNVGGILKPGLFVTAEITSGEAAEQHIVIPLNAVVEKNNQSLVFVKYGNEFQPVPVVPGQRTADQVEILEGLYEGDQVVTQGASQLYAQTLVGDRATDAHDHDEPAQDNPVGLVLLGLVLGVGLSGLGWWLMTQKTGNGKRGKR